MEANRPGVMSTQRKRIRRSQGCMAAQVIFHHRCEPTQVKIAVSTGDHKGCFAVTVLRCDFLHDIIGRAGHRVYATMRNPSRAPELAERTAQEKLPIKISVMDVDSDSSVKTAIA